MAVNECTICRMPQLAELHADIEAGLDDLAIATKYGSTRVTVQRHREHSGIGATATTRKVVPIRPGAQCSVCAHAKRAEIEASITSGDVWSTIGKRFFLDKEAVRLHTKQCAPHLRPSSNPNASALTQCYEIMAQARRLLDEVMDDTEASFGDKAKVIAAVNQLIVSLGRFTGELSNATEIVIVESPKWKRIENAIAEALAGHPEAAAAVAKRLQDLEAA